MPSNEHSESKRGVYDTCDPQYLRGLREAAGMDVFVLARTACLSVAQVRQLESDVSDGLFYSDAIKRQAYKRLLMILGAEPPSVELPQELRDAAKVADAHLNTLDQIVAMSHQPTLHRSTASMVSSVVSKLKEHRQVVSALLLLVVAFCLFVKYGLQPTGDVTLVAASDPEQVQSHAAAEVVAPEVSLPAPSASVPVVVPVASAAVPVANALLLTSNKSTSCAFASDEMPELTSFVAQKEGRYVYVVSMSNVEVCVVDGNKQATVLQMSAGENRSVFGVAPWQVSSPQLPKVQIYFQGGRVSLPDTATRVKLLEVPISR
jgi:hypothetical protein